MTRVVALLLLLVPGALPLGAQESAEGSGASDVFLRLPTLAGPVEDRIRFRQLRGRAPSRGYLLRSPSTLLGRAASDGAGTASSVSFRPLAPEIHAVHNSSLPFSLNEGPMWAGRGWSSRVTLGGRIRLGAVTLVLAPQLVHEQNRDFQTVSFPETGDTLRRHPLATPFHYPPGSADLPLRFGTDPRTFLDPGQSSLTVRTGPVAWGAATENLWWGPGVRNALLMGAQAPGVPHVFLRTAGPLETGVGTLEARWILGRLEESDYFDFDPDNDHRSLSALAVAFSPDFASGLSVGAARAVYAPAGDELVPLDAAADVFRNVGRPFAEPGDTLLEPGPDQLFTLFARWVFPDAGVEAYGEWGRYEQPADLRDLLEVPRRSRGYTVGLQYTHPVWVWPDHTPATLRVQAEATSLEPSPAYRIRPFGEWYASRRVPQGYTHRGRTLGAAIGPSGSSVWLASDLLGDDWRLGLFAGWIRWENQAQFTYFDEFRRADVSLFGGLRAGASLGPVRVYAEYAPGIRLNYLFQAQPIRPGRYRGVDIRNHTLKLTLSTGTPSL